jgi:hypothetical protein
MDSPAAILAALSLALSNGIVPPFRRFENYAALFFIPPD